ncbi:hypothetical protein MGLY_06850 [Neomoorella glycerini]|uniref:HTH araC/xylS-type domain-containing protein n=1 Tax=Neomoorella glycerini TaxID=55779 RepID=A0A6I5ZNC0_9FIRM|nr:hypothetical protein MGLY_06850 [Moorella glycerini]
MAVHVSPNYLCRLFRKELAISVMDYLMEIRIDHAKRLLENTNLFKGFRSCFQG